MKHLTLKAAVGEQMKGAGSKTFSDKQLILDVLNIPMESGIKINEMRQRINMIEKVEAVDDNGVLELEDAEYERLLSCIATTSYSVVSKSIVDLYARLEALR